MKQLCCKLQFAFRLFAVSMFYCFTDPVVTLIVTLTLPTFHLSTSWQQWNLIHTPQCGTL